MQRERETCEIRMHEIEMEKSWNENQRDSLLNKLMKGDWLIAKDILAFTL